MQKFEAESVIIGGGVVGLAVARSLALAGHKVFLLEQEEYLGSVTSSRNSGVIHAGLYYPKDSLKAELCVKGKEKLYKYCTEKGIPHKKCGKLVVAHDASEIAKLESLYDQSRCNNVRDVHLVGAVEMASIEPAVGGVAALYSPSSGIIDQHAFMAALEADILSHHGEIFCKTYAKSVTYTPSAIEITCEAEGEVFLLSAKNFINAAGLGAQELAKVFLDKNGMPILPIIPPLYYAKGHYFSLSGPSPFSRLIYPLHSSAGLGVHAGLDMAGQCRFGPDAQWVDKITYDVPESLKAAFIDSISRYWPEVHEYAEKLHPDYAGVRPKLVAKGHSPADFMIIGPKEHGCSGCVHLFGIESPGLTSSLAIGEYILEILEGL